MASDVDKPTANLVIRNAPEFTKRGRKKIAQWLRDQADHLEENGDLYAKQFRAGLRFIGARSGLGRGG